MDDLDFETIRENTVDIDETGLEIETCEGWEWVEES